MKVLITGASGQLGQALLKSAPSGAVVTALTHSAFDITDRASALECFRDHRPEVVINAAAYTAVDRAESEPERAYRVNADGAENLAVAAANSGARLLHVSTDFVFDGSSSSPYEVDAPTNPLNVYGATKRAGEEAVLRTIADSVVLRTSWVYAPWGTNFVRTMLRLMLEGRSIRVVADQVGTPTSALSVAGVLWKLAERKDVRGILHWSDAGVASWYDLAVAVAEESFARGIVPTMPEVVPITTSEYPTAARRPAYSVLSKSSVQRALGVMPSHWRANLRSVMGEIKNA